MPPCPIPTRRTVLALSFALLLALPGIAARADLVEQGPKDARPSGLQAGVAWADITPPVGIAHMNWGSATHIEAVGMDPNGLVAQALVLANGKQKFVMIDIDAVDADGYEAARAQVATAFGIPENHVRLGGTHTHSAPALSAGKGPAGVDLSAHKIVMQRYHETVIDKIVGAAVAADRALQPAHIHGGRGTGTININRRVRAQGDKPAAVGRNPDGYVDRELVVFRIDDARGKPIAILANFQCHGTVLAYENRYVSPDWIGGARRVVQQSFPGARLFFWQGAAGNQGPIEGFTGDLTVADRLGATLGHQIGAVALSIDTVRREPTFEGFVESTAYQAKQHWRVKGPRDATLKFASILVKVPRHRYSADEIGSMQERLRGAETALKKADRGGEPWKRQQAAARVRRFGDLLRAWQAPFDESMIEVEVQILRIGDLAIIAMPGEPFAEIGTAVKKASPFAFTMFAGYSSGKGGDYMPVADEYQHGGYEVERSPYGPEAAALVVKQAIGLFDKVR